MRTHWKRLLALLSAASMSMMSLSMPMTSVVPAVPTVFAEGDDSADPVDPSAADPTDPTSGPEVTADGSLIGDVNLDGQVDDLDVRIVLDFCAREAVAKEDVLLCSEDEATEKLARHNADVDGSGTIDAIDADYILQYISSTFADGVDPWEQLISRDDPPTGMDPVVLGIEAVQIDCEELKANDDPVTLTVKMLEAPAVTSYSFGITVSPEVAEVHVTDRFGHVAAAIQDNIIWITGASSYMLEDPTPIFELALVLPEDTAPDDVFDVTYLDTAPNTGADAFWARCSGTPCRFDCDALNGGVFVTGQVEETTETTETTPEPTETIPAPTETTPETTTTTEMTTAAWLHGVLKGNDTLAAGDKIVIDLNGASRQEVYLHINWLSPPSSEATSIFLTNGTWRTTFKVPSAQEGFTVDVFYHLEPLDVAYTIVHEGETAPPATTTTAETTTTTETTTTETTTSPIIPTETTPTETVPTEPPTETTTTTASTLPTEPPTETAESTEDTETTDIDDIVYGDVDGSGTVDILDVIAINKSLLGGLTLTGAGKAAADVDRNKAIDTTDALNILKAVVKLVTLPIQS